MSVFFSSRGRHRRWPRDWSSDVCSSDLEAPGGDIDHLREEPADRYRLRALRGGGRPDPGGEVLRRREEGAVGLLPAFLVHGQIGRASCREWRYKSGVYMCSSMSW